MRDQYLTKGYLVFRGIFPPSLLFDPGHQADIARNLAHKLNDPQTQLIQPLSQYGDKIDLQLFQDYVKLPILKDAVEKLLGPGYTHGYLHIMGLLVEPLGHPWHCGWHRDGVVAVPLASRNDEVRAALEEVWHDLRVFNQVNCALYADACTWYVPGRHLRSFDLPGERQSTGDPRISNPGPDISHVEAEHFYLEHCRAMPDAVQIHLNAGDFMIYRNPAWHTDFYLPYQVRANIHDIVSHADGNSLTECWRHAQQQTRAVFAASKEKTR